MGRNRTANVLPIIVVAFSITWVFFRPDLWTWVLGFAVIAIVMLALAYGAGIEQGRLRGAMDAKLEAQMEKDADEAEARLEAFKSALNEVELFAYELKEGLVPDGNSEHNPGYGPMDFNEWQEWKRKEFERTGNIWSSHPNGLPPEAYTDS